MTTTLVRRAGALALIAATTAGLTGCAGVVGARMTYNDTEKAKITEIVLSGGSGDVVITASPGVTETTVKRVIRRSDNPGESYRLDGTKLVLDTDCGPRCSASYEIKTPTSVLISGKMQSGDVKLDGIGGVEFELTSGDVVIAGPTGPVELRGTSGDLEILNAKAAVDVQATSGDLKVLNAAGPVKAQVTSGDVSVQLTKPGSVTAHATSGDLNVILPTGEYKVVSNVGSGDLNVNGLTSDSSSKNVIDVQVKSGDANVTAG
ncbi:MAG: DUF4097 family beta strand repeat-containing protein [Actinoplanes sp.]